MVYWSTNIAYDTMHRCDIFPCYLDNFLNVVIDKSIFNRAQLVLSDTMMRTHQL